MSIRVPGHRVLVKVSEPEKVSKGGIIFPEVDRLEKMAVTKGTVVQVGPDAWKTMYVNGYQAEPWAKVGDKVYWTKYVGRPIIDEETDEEFLLINDEDILVVI